MYKTRNYSYGLYFLLIYKYIFFLEYCLKWNSEFPEISTNVQY